jgi:hypothetical protein
MADSRRSLRRVSSDTPEPAGALAGAAVLVAEATDEEVVEEVVVAGAAWFSRSIQTGMPTAGVAMPPVMALGGAGAGLLGLSGA